VAAKDKTIPVPGAAEVTPQSRGPLLGHLVRIASPATPTCHDIDRTANEKDIAVRRFSTVHNMLPVPSLRTLSQAAPDSVCNAAAASSPRLERQWLWVLVSDIAAEAGASLPLSSTLLGTPGQSNGEWFVAYRGTDPLSSLWK
jgi:hypothetical protein